MIFRQPLGRVPISHEERGVEPDVYNIKLETQGEPLLVAKPPEKPGRPQQPRKWQALLQKLVRGSNHLKII